MRKIILGVAITSILVFAETSMDLEQILANSKNQENIIKNIEKYKNFKTTNLIKANSKVIENYKKEQEKILDEDLDKKLAESIDKYADANDGRFLAPMSTNQYKNISNKIADAKKIIKENLVGDYLLYFTSETVPNQSYQDFLLSFGILIENGVKINTKQYLVGVPKEDKKYLIGLIEPMSKLSMKEQQYIRPHIALKFDPRIFDFFKIEKVPVIIYATCAGVPSPKTCKFKYMTKGDIPLSDFFNRVSESEKDPIKKKIFKNYYEYLIGNKLITKEDQK